MRAQPTIGRSPQAELPRVGFVAGTLGRGGAERQLYYMARALVDAGQPPVVASLTRGEHWEGPIRELGVQVLWFGGSANPLRRTFDLIRLFRFRGLQLLQSAHFHTNLYTVGAARVLRMPEVGAIRSDTFWALDSLGRYGSPSLRLPRHLAINSLNAFDQAIGAGLPSTTLTHVPNVVDPWLFDPHPGPEPSGINLLSVGRLVDAKRHDIFLRLVRRLLDEVPEAAVCATIVGEGPLRGDILEMRDRLGLEGHVAVRANADMASVYHETSIFVLTSETEGMPNVLLEAMASGLPIVAFGVGGVPELVPTPDVGFCVAPLDEEGLYEATARLCTDRDLRARLGAEGRRLALDRFSPDRLHTSLQLLYRRVAAQQRFTSRRAPIGQAGRARVPLK